MYLLIKKVISNGKSIEKMADIRFKRRIA